MISHEKVYIPTDTSEPPIRRPATEGAFTTSAVSFPTFLSDRGWLYGLFGFVNIMGKTLWRFPEIGVPLFTSPGAILHHLLELAPTAWHTAYAKHQ